MSSNKVTLTDEGGFFALPDAHVLVVLLHAYNRTPKSLQRVAEVVREEYERSDIYAPKLPVHLFSWSDPDEIAFGILDCLAGRPEINSYRSIILVGHSLGAVIARKVWALAHGATSLARVDVGAARKWANNIDRIVLLAALNRGWMISSALNPLARLLWTLGTAWGNICRHVFRREPTIFAFRRGAPFLTAVRLQCLAVADALPDNLPVTVQLLGTADDYVAPTDNLDLATGQQFYYMEVAEATHGGIIDLDEGEGSEAALARFRLALNGSSQSLGENSLAIEDVFDLYDVATDDYGIQTLPLKNTKVKHVVFVIHGIRDRGFWTRRIAREVKSLARKGNEPCQAVTSTYGYFPMGPFLLPWVRRGKVEWLLDQYVTAKSLYPDAKFSYVGHSNGTYLLAKAIEICPAVCFAHVVFGGSVVRSRFGWSEYIPERVMRILNYVATADNVVAIFPHGLERLGVQDVGGAGHNGFVDPQATNVRYIEGGHSAALGKKRWQEIADFVLHGPLPPDPVPVPLQSTVTLWLGRLAPMIWLLLAALTLGMGGLLLVPLGASGWIFAIMFALYLYLLRVILTRA